MNPLTKRRMGLVVILLVVIVAALASRRYPDRLPGFVVAHAGDTLWTVAAYLVAAIAFPRLPPRWLGSWALGISVLVETSQLLDWQVLNWCRALPGGRLVWGHGFLWMDLARYVVGALLATTLDWWCSGKQQRPGSDEPR